MPIDPTLAVDPSFATQGVEWQIGSPAGAETAPAEGTGFSNMLGEQISNLSNLQTEGAEAARSLAAGTATDPSEVVMALERARLAMQLASQIRTKSVESFQEIFRTQV